MPNVKLIQQLLLQTANIHRKYEEEIKQNGGNWNIFYAIGKNLYEQELLHSHFLSVLLAYKDEITQENIFLQRFLEKINEVSNKQTDFSLFYTGPIKIYTEKSIGHIIENYEEGGRIDILIEKGNRQIIIENKIYAADQPKQLSRYHKKYPKATIIYLTLDGKPPTLQSTNNLQEEQYICISYHTHILQWLTECQKYTARNKENLFLNIAIQQYIRLISDLTGQGRCPKMTQQISEILTQNKENLLSAQDISNSLIMARNKVLTDKLLNPLSDFIQKQYSTEIKLTTRTREGIISEFDINVPAWKKIILRFNYELGGIYGLGFKSEEDIKADNDTISEFIKQHNEYFRQDLQTPWWPLIYKTEEPYRFWDFKIILSLFDNADEIINYYKTKITDLFTVAEKLKSNGIKL